MAMYCMNHLGEGNLHHHQLHHYSSIHGTAHKSQLHNPCSLLFCCPRKLPLPLASSYEISMMTKARDVSMRVITAHTQKKNKSFSGAHMKNTLVFIHGRKLTGLAM